MGEDQARSDVLRLQKRILAQYRLRSIPGCQLSQDMLHGDTHVADDRLAAEDIGTDGDAIEQFEPLCYSRPL